MTRLAILGPGLLGGSIALATRRLGCFHTSLWARRSEAVEEIRNMGIADFASSELRAVVKDADLIVLCVPIGAMPEIARAIVGFISPEAIVTDVGSVKACVVSELGQIFSGRGRFIGSHPMAGSEQAGLLAARDGLFESAACLVTPDELSDAGAVASVRAFWERLGCTVTEISPREHDELVASISHFPHLLAATLVQTVAAEKPRAFNFAGPGFRDATRIAAGPPVMWSEILYANRHAVRKSAEAMIEKLREIVTVLDCQERMIEYLTQAQARRERLRLFKNTDV